MSVSDFQHIVQDLKKELKNWEPQGAQRFLSFVDTYAQDRSLYYKAILLHRKKVIGKDTSETTAEGENVFDQLIDQVATAHIENGVDLNLGNRTDTQLEKISARLEEEASIRPVVFEGENISKSYRRSSFELKDINLILRAGEITSVIGENGNGKTTLFRTIVGEIKHSSGILFYPEINPEKGKRVHWSKVNQIMAYVPQDLPNWNRSLREMIQFEAATHGILGEENKIAVDYIIQRFGLEAHLGKKWNELSGGFKLRFYLAKSLVWKPKLLVIDEPLANLDIKTQLMVLNDLRTLCDSYKYPLSILLSSQHLHEIEAVSDNILFLKEGEVSYQGTLKDLGKDRKINMFEFYCSLSFTEIQTILQDFPYEKLHHNGISYVITTSLNQEANDLIQYLIGKRIELTYFRDISKSVKQLFER